MYTFTKTEQNNLRASTFETKSLLYLAGKSSKYKNINVIVIDCFNDVTGMCSNERMWDVQAKNEQKLTPRKIGTYLITLFENYTSNFSHYFHEYIFFMPKLNGSYLSDSSKKVYDVTNFNEEQQTKIIDGLRSKSSESDVNLIKSFISQVQFVEDRSEEQTYIKNLVKFRPSAIREDAFFKELFQEIRDKQTGIKNSEIENETINRPKDVLSYDRYIKTETLQVLVLNRFVGGDIFTNKRKIPLSYVPFIRKVDDDELEDHMFSLNSAISKAFFDKNNQKPFWKLFESIFRLLSNSNKASVQTVMNKLDEKTMDKVQHMDFESTRFLVALIKDGLKNDN